MATVVRLNSDGDGGCWVVQTGNFGMSFTTTAGRSGLQASTTDRPLFEMLRLWNLLVKK